MQKAWSKPRKISKRDAAASIEFAKPRRVTHVPPNKPEADPDAPDYPATPFLSS